MCRGNSRAAAAAQEILETLSGLKGMCHENTYVFTLIHLFDCLIQNDNAIINFN